MSDVDIVLVVLGAVTVLLTGATLLVAALTLKATDRDVRASEKTLELAREEARRYPRLEVTDTSLTDANESEIVIQTREARRVEEKTLEEYRELYKNQPNGGIRAQIESRNKIRKMGYRTSQLLYEGSFPDLILEFWLHNKSSAAVKKLAVSVQFDTKFLEPIDFPRLIDSEWLRSSEIRLSVDNLPPSYSGEARVFKVALLQKKSGQTTATATFSNQEGYYLREHILLDVT